MKMMVKFIKNKEIINENIESSNEMINKNIENNDEFYEEMKIMINFMKKI